MERRESKLPKEKNWWLAAMEKAINGEIGSQEKKRMDDILMMSVRPTRS